METIDKIIDLISNIINLITAIIAYKAITKGKK